MSGVADRIRTWRPRTPPLPPDLAGMVGPDDPEWFARELAIAAAPPWWWRLLLRWSPVVPAVAGRLQVTGSVPDAWRSGPLLLAANHIGDFDPFVVNAALAWAGVTPRFMVTGGVLRTPVAGPLLERCTAARR